jgi:hypothetical protein
MLAFCAGHDLTIELRDGKAWVTLLRCTILVKTKNSENASKLALWHKNQAKRPIFC